MSEARRSMKLAGRFVVAMVSLGIGCGTSLGSTWSDSAISALAASGQEQLERVLQRETPDKTALTDFVDISKVLRGLSEGERLGRRLSQVMDGRIVGQYGVTTFNSYASVLPDTSLPSWSKTYVLKIMVLASDRLPASYQDSLQAVLAGLLRGAVTPPELKVVALQYLGRLPKTRFGDFRPFLDSGNPDIQSAAYVGLGKLVLVNRTSANRADNRAIFDSLTTGIANELPADRLKVLALMGEEYARNRLLAECAGNVEKIGLVFRHDSEVDHPGLIKEGVRLVRASASPKVLEKAIVQGIGQPDEIVQGLFAGSTGDIESGLHLLKMYPDAAARHAAPIRSFSENANPEIRTAAKSLLPLLPSSLGSAQ